MTEFSTGTTLFAYYKAANHTASYFMNNSIDLKLYDQRSIMEIMVYSTVL